MWSGVAGASLGVLSVLVVWSFVSGAGLLVERIIPLVGDWMPVKDMSKLYELSSTVSCVFEEWLDDQILDSFGDRTC